MNRTKFVFISHLESKYGAEYLSVFLKENFIPDKIILKNIPNYCINEEVDFVQYGGLWNPPAIREIITEFPAGVVVFSNNILEDIRNEKSDTPLFILPVDIGIIKKNMLTTPNTIWINVHPGELPYFRGCSAPEWQILSSGNCKMTLHKMSSGIDEGDVLLIDEMEIKKDWGYYDFRSNIYTFCAQLLIKGIQLIRAGKLNKESWIKQDSSLAKYWPPMKKEDDLKKVHDFFKNRLK